MTILMRGGNKLETLGLSGSGDATVVSPSATANTKGSYVELDASTAFHVCGIILEVYGGNGLTYTGADVLLDIAVGAAASEVDVIQNLPVTGLAQFAISYQSVWVPVEIPAGSRVSARCQASAGSAGDVEVAIILQASHPCTPRGLSEWVAYGADTATSGAVTLAANFGSPTAYSEVTASLPKHGSMLYVVAQGGGIASRSGTKFSVDVAIGAAASEVDYVTVPVSAQSQENVSPWVSGPFFVDIPATSRLAVRAEAKSGAGSDIDIALLIGH